MVYCKKDQKADIDISREGKKMKNAPAYVKVYSRLKNESFLSVIGELLSIVHQLL